MWPDRPGERVEAEDGVRARVVEHALLHHPLGAAQLVARNALLGRLEDEHHGARQAVAHAGKDLGGAHQHRSVRVVPARVHHADLLAAPLRLHLRGVGDVEFLGDRQRVHVGPKRDHPSGLAAAQDADDAGLRHAGANLQAQLAQVVGDDAGRARLLVAEFRVLVEVAAPGDDASGHVRGAPVDLGLRAAGVWARGGGVWPGKAAGA